MKADLALNLQIFNYPVKVLRVIDGDTLVLDIDLGMHTQVCEETVRLFGINTPEISGVNASPDGQRAKQYAEAWIMGKDTAAIQTWMPPVLRPILSGFYLKTERFDKREKYGRLLGTLFRRHDTVSLNDSLVNAGLAKVYRP